MSGVNKIVRSDAAYSVIPDATAYVDSSVSLNQGDLVVFAAGLLALASSETEGANFLGIMPVTIASGKLASPYVGTAVDAAQAVSSIPGPTSDVVAKCVSKTGVAWTVGAAVYLDPATGSRGVTSSGTKLIGLYQGPAIASAAAGQEVEVFLKQQVL